MRKPRERITTSHSQPGSSEQGGKEDGGSAGSVMCTRCILSQLRTSFPDYNCRVNAHGFHILGNVQNLAKQVKSPLSFVRCHSLQTGFQEKKMDKFDYIKIKISRPKNNSSKVKVGKVYHRQKLILLMNKELLNSEEQKITTQDRNA